MDDFTFGPGSSRPPTHRPLELEKLVRLSIELRDVAVDGEVTPEIVEGVACDQGVPRGHVYAALAVSPDLRLRPSAAVAFTVCAGGCQQWGSLERLEQLLAARELRLARGAPAFDVRTRSCLDKCDFGPTILVETPHGTVFVLMATKDKVDAALAEIEDRP
jgi:NADH:ubiquinone oxidoreductase subunit E